MNLKTTEFSEEEKQKKFKLTNFSEMGMDIFILNELDNFHKIPSGNFYKFGVFKDGKYYWYWYGKPVADSRNKMYEIYNALNKIKKDNEIPFIYKVKKL
jgi:hypothetical protein